MRPLLRGESGLRLGAGDGGAPCCCCCGQTGYLMRGAGDGNYRPITGAGDGGSRGPVGRYIHVI